MENKKAPNIPQGQTMVQFAYDEIRSMIFESKKLFPGQQIVETAIAEMLGISRTPVREAVQQLKRDGLVEYVRNKGSFVRIVSLDELIQYHELGAGLNGMNAWLFAERVQKGTSPPEVLTAIDELLSKMDKVLVDGNINLWASLDRQYHNTLAKGSGTIYLFQQLVLISDLLKHDQWYISPVLNDCAISHMQHRQIIDAIKRGDCETARMRAQEHCQNTRNKLIALKNTSSSET